MKVVVFVECCGEVQGDEERNVFGFGYIGW